MPRAPGVARLRNLGGKVNIVCPFILVSVQAGRAIEGEAVVPTVRVRRSQRAGRGATLSDSCLNSRRAFSVILCHF